MDLDDALQAATARVSMLERAVAQHEADAEFNAEHSRELRGRAEAAERDIAEIVAALGDRMDASDGDTDATYTPAGAVRMVLLVLARTERERDEARAENEALRATIARILPTKEERLSFVSACRHLHHGDACAAIDAAHLDAYLTRIEAEKTR